MRDSRIQAREMSLRVIKDEETYKQYLSDLRELLLEPPIPGSSDEARLELLSVLVETYENERFLMSSIDPIDAITMKMTEMNLAQKDLAPLLGGASRISEILNRKRKLSLDQIRALNQKLGIPTDVLIGKDDAQIPVLSDAEIKKLPIREMLERGWFGEIASSVTDAVTQCREFLARVEIGSTPVFLRQTVHGRIEESAKLSTYAWLSRIVLRARESKRPSSRFSVASVTREFLQQVSKLSAADNGPKLAQEFLAMKGISLVVEPQLRGMKLDGAVIRDNDGLAVIGLTLRYDRIDSFWFTLLHELAHLHRHFGNQSVAFVDDTTSPNEDDIRELEADSIAAECLIPRSIWDRAHLAKSRNVEAISDLAAELCIHPAIIAGRIRRESNNYSVLSKLVGTGDVRKHFPNSVWEA